MKPALRPHGHGRWAPAALGIAVVCALAVPTSAGTLHVARDYELLTPGAQSFYAIDGGLKADDTEFYDVLPATTAFNGATVSVVKTTRGPDDGTLTYLTNDDQGLRIHGLMIPDRDGDDDLTVVYDPPLVLLGKTFEAGSVFSTHSDVLDLGKAQLEFRMEHTVEVLGFEEIHVPAEAGFIETVKLQRTIVARHRPDEVGETKKTRYVWMWLARGMGLVRSEYCEKQCLDELIAGSPEHTQWVMLSNTTYLPEPSQALQGLVGILGVAALGRWRTWRD